MGATLIITFLLGVLIIFASLPVSHLRLRRLDHAVGTALIVLSLVFAAYFYL